MRPFKSIDQYPKEFLTLSEAAARWLYDGHPTNHPIMELFPYDTIARANTFPIQFPDYALAFRHRRLFYNFRTTLKNVLSEIEHAPGSYPQTLLDGAECFIIPRIYPVQEDAHLLSVEELKKLHHLPHIVRFSLAKTVQATDNDVEQRIQRLQELTQSAPAKTIPLQDAPDDDIPETPARPEPSRQIFTITIDGSTFEIPGEDIIPKGALFVTPATTNIHVQTWLKAGMATTALPLDEYAV